MGADQSRIRTDNAPEILSMMRTWGAQHINQHKGNISVKHMLMKWATFPNPLLLILQNI